MLYDGDDDHLTATEICSIQRQHNPQINETQTLIDFLFVSPLIYPIQGRNGS